MFTDMLAVGTPVGGGYEQGELVFASGESTKTINLPFIPTKFIVYSVGSGSNPILKITVVDTDNNIGMATYRTTAGGTVNVRFSSSQDIWVSINENVVTVSKTADAFNGVTQYWIAQL